MVGKNYGLCLFFLPCRSPCQNGETERLALEQRQLHLLLGHEEGGGGGGEGGLVVAVVEDYGGGAAAEVPVATKPYDV